MMVGSRLFRQREKLGRLEGFTVEPRTRLRCGMCRSRDIEARLLEQDLGRGLVIAASLDQLDSVMQIGFAARQPLSQVYWIFGPEKHVEPPALDPLGFGLREIFDDGHLRSSFLCLATVKSCEDFSIPTIARVVPWG